MQKISIGSWITLYHPSIVEIMVNAGFDWLCVDMEHSVIDFNHAQIMIAAIQSKGIDAYVRVGENNQRIIKRILDAGADGIIAPLVSTKEEAQRAVNAVKYPPVGTRGVGLARAQNYGLKGGFEKYRDGKAKEIKLIVQIEHIDAIKNLDGILETDGVDGSIIGPYDLSGSMGKPGQYHDDDVISALKSYERTAVKYDKLIGFHVVEPDHEAFLKRKSDGYNFLAFSTDALFMGRKCIHEMNMIKENL